MGLFGEEFKTGTLALMFLTTGQFVNAASGSVALILGMTGKEKFASYVILIATIINFMLNFVLIPKLGINGAAVASMVGLMFWNIIFLIYIYNFTSLPHNMNHPDTDHHNNIHLPIPYDTVYQRLCPFHKTRGISFG